MPLPKQQQNDNGPVHICASSLPWPNLDEVQARQSYASVRRLGGVAPRLVSIRRATDKPTSPLTVGRQGALSFTRASEPRSTNRCRIYAHSIIATERNFTILRLKNLRMGVRFNGHF